MPSLLTMVFTDVTESTATKRDNSLGRDSRERDHAYLERVQTRHLELVRRCCRDHGGREINTMGDAFFLAFEDPVEAVRCAVAIQERLAVEPIDTPRGHLRLRIGIHSGYPEFFENSYHGTDVDTAARVESAAAPGQILLSSVTHELVRHMSDVRFLNVGDFVLKGVGRMQLWEADWGSAGSRPKVTRTLDAQRRKKNTRLALAIGAASVAMAMAVAYRYYTAPKVGIKTEQARKVGSSINPRRSVAVLGFKNLGEPQEGWLSTAIRETLAAELAQGAQLRAISGESVDQAKIDLSLPDAESYTSQTLARIGKTLGADIVVLGSYLALKKEGGGELRLSVCLQDTAAGTTVWTNSESGAKEKLFDLVSRAGSGVRRALGARDLTVPEAAYVRSSLPSDPEAMRLYSEGLQKLRTFDWLAARDTLEKVTTAQPDFAPGYSALAAAWSYLGYDEKAKAQAKKALDLSANFSPEDRLSIEARYGEVGHQWNKAIEAYRDLWRIYPDNSDYGLGLADAQARGSKPKDALVTVEVLRKLPLPQGSDPRIDLAESLAHFYLQDFARCKAASGQAVEKGMESNSRILVAQARNRLGIAETELGEFEAAEADLEGAKRIWSEVGSLSGEGRAVANLGILWEQQGKYKEAERAFRDALSLFRKSGNTLGEAGMLSNIGAVLNAQGSFSEARDQLMASLAKSREIDDQYTASRTLSNIGIALAGAGDLAGAKDAYLQSLPITQAIGDKPGEAAALGNLAWALHLQGEIGEARKRSEESVGLARQTGGKSHLAYSLFGLGNILADEGDLAAARQAHEEALSVRRALGEKVAVFQSEIALSNLTVEEGKAALADVPGASCAPGAASREARR